MHSSKVALSSLVISPFPCHLDQCFSNFIVPMNRLGPLSECRFCRSGLEPDFQECRHAAAAAAAAGQAHILNDKNLDSESLEGSGLCSIHFGVLGTKLRALQVGEPNECF